MENTLPTPVLQSEINECGLACIAMLAETQGVRAPLTELRERYPASQHGTSLATLCAILGSWRCRLIRWRSSTGIWRRCLYRRFCITARATMYCWHIVRAVTYA